jgi:fumarate reductase subunit D
LTAMPKRPVEPVFWLLFSGGGIVAALFLPVLLFLFGVAIPMGLIDPPDHAHLLAVVRHPITRVVLAGVCVLSLFHAAHRLRYTIQDGLQLKRLGRPVEVVSYGAAIVLSAGVAAYLLLLPV